MTLPPPPVTRSGKRRASAARSCANLPCTPSTSAKASRLRPPAYRRSTRTPRVLHAPPAPGPSRTTTGIPRTNMACIRLGDPRASSSHASVSVPRSHPAKAKPKSTRPCYTPDVKKRPFNVPTSGVGWVAASGRRHMFKGVFFSFVLALSPTAQYMYIYCYN
jgi:hypothetical protein